MGLLEHYLATERASLIERRVRFRTIGRLELLPEGFFLLAPTRFWPFLLTPLFSWRGKLRMARELVLPSGEATEDESLGDFVRRRFGSEALERVAQPLVGGIYAADPDKLSLAATLPRFQEMERKHGSVIRAMWREQRRRRTSRESGSGARWSLFVSLAGGMQEFIDALGRQLPAGSVRLSAAAVDLSRDRDGRGWNISVKNGKDLHADAVILATPAFRAGQLLASTTHEAADELKRIAYASTATVNLAYRLRDIPRPLDGFGFVVPAVERRKIMACTFSSLKYPGRAPDGHILLRAFVGGALQRERFNDDDAVMEQNVRDELSALIGVTVRPLLARIYRHPNSMPQYHVGHQARVRRIESSLSRFPSLALCGSAYHGVGISDCVRTGEQAAESVMHHLLAP